MLNAWLGMGYLDKPAFSEKAIAYLQKAAADIIRLDFAVMASLLSG
jgi:hypothetical protein